MADMYVHRLRSLPTSDPNIPPSSTYTDHYPAYADTPTTHPHHSSYTLSPPQAYYPTVPYPNQPILQRAPTSYHLGPAAEAPAEQVRDPYHRQRTYSYPHGDGVRSQGERRRSAQDIYERERYPEDRDRGRYIEDRKDRARQTPSPRLEVRRQRSYSASEYPPEPSRRLSVPRDSTGRRSFEREIRSEGREEGRYERDLRPEAPRQHVRPKEDRRRSNSPY
jgi:hypothetical protein